MVESARLYMNQLLIGLLKSFKLQTLIPGGVKNEYGMFSQYQDKLSTISITLSHHA
jgi:hypothetical protein